MTKPRNDVYDTPTGYGYLIDTPEGKKNGYQWAIAEHDLFERTPWGPKDLANLTEDDMDAFSGRDGFFIL